jgi:SAM-dependent methyltransferase
VSERVVGIEPNEAMCAQAEAETAAANVEYLVAFADATGLAEGSADIVTCSQALHWMEPEPTFAEAARILRPGGVFAAYDYDVPPTCDWEVEDAFAAFLDRRRALRASLGMRKGADSWPKEGHLERMRASSRFRFCREFVLQSVEDGSAERIVGFARSLGLPAADLADDELERTLRHGKLEDVARRVWGGREVPFRFGYRVRIGVA